MNRKNCVSKRKLHSNEVFKQVYVFKTDLGILYHIFWGNGRETQLSSRT